MKRQLGFGLLSLLLILGVGVYSETRSEDKSKEKSSAKKEPTHKEETPGTQIKEGG